MLDTGAHDLCVYNIIAGAKSP